jgi:agmatine/peptidylarginine deiminase
MDHRSSLLTNVHCVHVVIDQNTRNTTQNCATNAGFLMEFLGRRQKGWLANGNIGSAS